MEKENEIEIVRPYKELRKLKNPDAYTILNILRKAGLRENSEIYSLMQNIALNGRKASEVGFEVVYKMIISLVSNVPDVAEDLDCFCADVAGMTIDELNNSDFGTSFLIVYDLIKDGKNFPFFKAVLGSL